MAWRRLVRHECIPACPAGDEFVKYWDGSTTPTADYVRHVDAGEVDVRGSDVLTDASAP